MSSDDMTVFTWLTRIVLGLCEWLTYNNAPGAQLKSQSQFCARPDCSDLYLTCFSYKLSLLSSVDSNVVVMLSSYTAIIHTQMLSSVDSTAIFGIDSKPAIANTLSMVDSTAHMQSSVDSRHAIFRLLFGINSKYAIFGR